MRTARSWIAVTTALLLAVGCAEEDGIAPEAPGANEDDGADREPAEPEADDPHTDVDEPTPDEVDHEAAVEEARALLGTPEDEIIEDAETRIVRRGDERLPATMDLRPGRKNLELDDDGTGTYVVTRVVVETLEGEDAVVE